MSAARGRLGAMLLTQSRRMKRLETLCWFFRPFLQVTGTKSDKRSLFQLMALNQMEAQ